MDGYDNNDDGTTNMVKEIEDIIDPFKKGKFLPLYDVLRNINPNGIAIIPTDFKFIKSEDK